MFSYKYSEKNLPFMTKQVSQAFNAIDSYSLLSKIEYNHYKNHLPLNPKNIMDYGCGLGRVGIYLNHVYNNDNINFHFVDADGVSNNQQKTGGIYDKEDIYYNDLKMTEEFCHKNNVKNVNTYDYRYTDWNKVDKMDLIISCCSVGVHVPIEKVLDNMLKISSKDCVFIFSTRTNKNKFPEYARMNIDYNYLKKYFDEIEFIEGIYEKNLPKLPEFDFLICKKKK